MAIFGRSFPIRGVTIERGINLVLGGSQTLVPSLFVDVDALYLPTVTYSNSLLPSLFDDSANDSLFSTTVLSVNTLAPSLISDSTNDAFYAPTVVPGAVTLTPALFSDGDTFYVPVISLFLVSSPFSDADATYSPVVSSTATLLPPLLANDDAFLSLTLSETDTVAPSLFS